MPGWVDGLDAFGVYGWAIQADNKTSDRVAVYIEDNQIAEIPCDLPRPDVQRAGFGMGDGGFRFIFPECIALTRPRKVVVRTVSSGHLLQFSKACVESLSNETNYPLVRPALFDACFAADSYATDPRSLVRSQGASNVVTRQAQYTLSARILVPHDADIGILPADEAQGVEVSSLDIVNDPLAQFPEGMSNFKNIQFGFSLPMPQHKQYAAFHLVDKNAKSPNGGQNSSNPAALLCAPLREDWLTAPSDRNIERTCGPASWSLFSLSGVWIAYQMKSLADKFLGNHRPLTILDWGIGCGRVAIPMKRGMLQDATVLGVDVDQINVDWCKTNARDIEVHRSDFYPPLEIDAGSIDMVYGISVMTHLTEGAQMSWLKELSRIVKIGGICVLTIHGEHALLVQNLTDPDVIKPLSKIGISDALLDENLGPKLDIKRYYRATFQLRRQVEEQWSRFFKIIAYFPGGLQCHQDIVVMRKV